MTDTLKKLICQCFEDVIEDRMFKEYITIIKPNIDNNHTRRLKNDEEYHNIVPLSYLKHKNICKKEILEENKIILKHTEFIKANVLLYNIFSLNATEEKQYIAKSIIEKIYRLLRISKTTKNKGISENRKYQIYFKIKNKMNLLREDYEDFCKIMDNHYLGKRKTASV